MLASMTAKSAVTKESRRAVSLMPKMTVEGLCSQVGEVEGIPWRECRAAPSGIRREIICKYRRELGDSQSRRAQETTKIGARFEFDGIQVLPAQRTGIGGRLRGFRDFRDYSDNTAMFLCWVAPSDLLPPCINDPLPLPLGCLTVLKGTDAWVQMYESLNAFHGSARFLSPRSGCFL